MVWYGLIWCNMGVQQHTSWFMNDWMIPTWPVETVSFPSKNGGSFRRKLWLFSRGYTVCGEHATCSSQNKNNGLNAKDGSGRNGDLLMLAMIFFTDQIDLLWSCRSMVIVLYTMIITIDEYCHSIATSWIYYLEYSHHTDITIINNILWLSITGICGIKLTSRYFK